MNESELNELLDKAMAGRLTAEEQGAWEKVLAERPELELDAELGRALQALPPPPSVATNFTARVLLEINRQAPAALRNGWRQWLRFPRLARLTGTAAVLALIGFGVVQQHRSRERQLVDSVKTFASGVTAVAPGQQARPDEIVNVLQDFEAIRRIPAARTEVDYGLLTALRTTE